MIINNKNRVNLISTSQQTNIITAEKVKRIEGANGVLYKIPGSNKVYKI